MFIILNQPRLWIWRSIADCMTCPQQAKRLTSYLVSWTIWKRKPKMTNYNALYQFCIRCYSHLKHRAPSHPLHMCLFLSLIHWSICAYTWSRLWYLMYFLWPTQNKKKNTIELWFSCQLIKHARVYGAYVFKPGGEIQEHDNHNQDKQESNCNGGYVYTAQRNASTSSIPRWVPWMRIGAFFWLLLAGAGSIKSSFNHCNSRTKGRCAKDPLLARRMRAEGTWHAHLAVFAPATERAGCKWTIITRLVLWAICRICWLFSNMLIKAVWNWISYQDKRFRISIVDKYACTHL